MRIRGGAEEGDGSLVVVGGDGAELLEFGEEVFNQMPGFVQVLTRGPLGVTFSLIGHAKSDLSLFLSAD